MEEYVSINEVLEVASGAAGCKYKPIPRKKILFQSTLGDGSSIVLCTPQSKMHPQGFGWVDITSVQYETFEEYDNAMLIFRLQGRLLSMINWAELKPHFLESCMRYNDKEGNHWKLNIYTDHIYVNGNPDTIPVKAFQYTGKKTD